MVEGRKTIITNLFTIILHVVLIVECHSTFYLLLSTQFILI
jgi:hypothetical protein